MLKNKSSETAEGVASYRAMESQRPENDRVIYDPYAKLFLGKKWLRWVKYPFLTWLFYILGNIKFPGFRGSVIARVSFMNQCIKECFPSEFNQLVVLGAGYDMSGFIFQDILSNAKVFELDHPNTQRYKKEKIKKHLKDVPENIFYIEIDFETDDIKTKLLEYGYSQSQKTLFILEGVIYYLEKEAVKQTFNFVTQNSACGSKIAFDFFPPEVVDGTSNEKLGKEMFKLVQKIGEPYKFGINSADIDAFLKQCQFTHIKKYSSRDIRDTHFHGENKKMVVSQLFNFVCATT